MLEKTVITITLLVVSVIMTKGFIGISESHKKTSSSTLKDVKSETRAPIRIKTPNGSEKGRYSIPLKGELTV